MYIQHISFSYFFYFVCKEYVFLVFCNQYLRGSIKIIFSQFSQLRIVSREANIVIVVIETIIGSIYHLFIFYLRYKLINNFFFVYFNCIIDK